MGMRTIVFYTTTAGKCPAREFLDSLGAKDARKAAYVLRLVMILDRVPAEFFKKLVGTEDIWECRIKTTTGAYRLFSFFFQGDTVVVTNGYSKKTDKTDPHEIERAERYRRDYLARHGRT